MTTHESVSQCDALDIVFANRNRAYGAYQLRREYPNALGRALGVALLLMGAIVLLTHILAALSSKLSEAPPEAPDEERSITEFKVETPPPTVLSPPPPSIAYTPPVVAPDNEVSEEAPVDVQTVLEDPRNVGSQTITGIDEAPPSLDPPGTGLDIIEALKPAEDEPFESFAVNKMPSFPGGEAEMFKWIYKHIVYPEMAREAGTEGSVVLTFVVGKDGGITDIAVVRTPAGGSILGKEATRVVKSMPLWSPGEANGHPVKVRFTLPIRFALK
ncbi:MAG: TonB family protein [Saprospiraceae bacterium]|nr:TonB family protein [Saprospiraceae bacterium]